jgi:transposase
MKLGTSKRGDRYVPTWLIHWARTSVRYAARRVDRRRGWVTELNERRGTNVAAVVLAEQECMCDVGYAYAWCYV